MKTGDHRSVSSRARPVSSRGGLDTGHKALMPGVRMYGNIKHAVGTISIALLALHSWTWFTKTQCTTVRRPS
jgi:hypothetical protein|eukprot:COSAG02_NODE_6320_length_3652_cov_2.885449_2_plen_72_part_00